MPEFLKVEREGRTLIITLQRPNVMNSLHAPACRELSEVLDDFQAEQQAMAVFFK